MRLQSIRCRNKNESIVYTKEMEDDLFALSIF